MFNWSKSDAIVLPVALVIIIVLAVVFRLILGKSKYRRIPLKALAVIIVCLEIAKQIYYNIYEPFTMYIFPFHFCSTFIVLIPLAQFTKGKFNEVVKPLPFCYSVLVLVLLYAYPKVLLGNATMGVFKNFHNFHTIAFHHVILAYFVYSVALNDYKPKKTDLIPLICGILVYGAYAVPIAYAYNVNYVNILRSDFPPFEKIRLLAGQVVYDIVLFLTAACSVTAIWLVSYLLSKFKLAPQPNASDEEPETEPEQGI